MLYSDPQLDTVIRRMNQILSRAKIPFGRLHRSVAQQQLDLLQLAAGGPAQLRRRAAAIVRRDARDASSRRIWPEHLPDHLFGQDVALHLVAAVDAPEHMTVLHAGGTGPGIDCNFDPSWHRNRPHAAVLSNKVYNAPASVPLLNVLERVPLRNSFLSHFQDGMML
jgi:hypothetical protein